MTVRRTGQPRRRRIRYVADDPRIRIVAGPNGGVAVARNRGLSGTNPSTSFVILLDSDDTWEPHALETLIAALDNNPGCIAAHAVAQCVDGNGLAMPGDDLPEQMSRRKGVRDGTLVSLQRDEPTTFNELVWHNWVCTPGLCLVRRDIADRVGSFDPAHRSSRRLGLRNTPEPSRQPRLRRQYLAQLASARRVTHE